MQPVQWMCACVCCGAAVVPLLFGAPHLRSASLIRAVQDCRLQVLGAHRSRCALSLSLLSRCPALGPVVRACCGVACVCGCNWLATVTTVPPETLPIPRCDWSVYEVASAGQGAIWASWHLATLAVPYRAVRLRERQDLRCNLYTGAHTSVP